jgi:hypothetical protein
MSAFDTMPLESPETVHNEPDGEDAIRAIVVRLARPYPRGEVIERAAILAEGVTSRAIVEWIVAHAGEPETAAATSAPRGLHSARGTAEPATLRYVLPSDALT